MLTWFEKCFGQKPTGPQPGDRVVIVATHDSKHNLCDTLGDRSMDGYFYIFPSQTIKTDYHPCEIASALVIETVDTEIPMWGVIAYKLLLTFKNGDLRYVLVDKRAILLYAKYEHSKIR